MSEIDVNTLLAEMRTLTAQARGLTPAVSDVSPESRESAKSPVNFAELLKQSIDSVNTMQQQSSHLKESFEKGDPDVSLADVMIASQKASIAFQGTVQIRNKLVDAYQEVMRMPV